MPPQSLARRLYCRECVTVLCSFYCCHFVCLGAVHFEWEVKLQTTAAESAKGEAEKQANIATTQREIADQRADILFVQRKT